MRMRFQKFDFRTSGNFLMFPKEISRSFLWRLEGRNWGLVLLREQHRRNTESELIFLIFAANLWWNIKSAEETRLLTWHSCAEWVSLQLTPFFRARQKFVFWDFQKFDFRTSGSFLWKHEKDGNIHPVLPQLYIPYGMKRPAGENKHYPTPVKDTVTSNDGILQLPLRIKPASEMIVFCFAFAKWPLLLLRVTSSENLNLWPKP